MLFTGNNAKRRAQRDNGQNNSQRRRNTSLEVSFGSFPLQLRKSKTFVLNFSRAAESHQHIEFREKIHATQRAAAHTYFLIIPHHHLQHRLLSIHRRGRPVVQPT